MIEPKQYQEETLEAVRAYLEKLAELRAAVAGLKGRIDWAGAAWDQKAEKGTPYMPRRNGLGAPLPSYCLKIPTGGGKTLLATKAIDLANTHFRKQPRLGFVDRPDHADLQPDPFRPQGPRPSLSADP